MALPVAVLPGGPGGAVCAYADGAHHAAVVVQHGNGSRTTRCVAFTAASISGEDALNGSQLEWGYYDYRNSLGKGVCQVEYEPPTPPGGWTRDNCLGASYWGIWYAHGGGGWSATAHGVSHTSLADGDALGLAYGDGTSPPPSPAGVCPAPPAQAPTPAPAAAPPSTGPGSPPGGPSTGSARVERTATGATAAVPAAPAATTSPPAIATAAGTDPGVVALGGGGTPQAPRAAVAPTPQSTGTQSPPLGWLAAAATAVGLLAMLLVQLMLPRFRGGP